MITKTSTLYPGNSVVEMKMKFAELEDAHFGKEILEYLARCNIQRWASSSFSSAWLIYLNFFPDGKGPEKNIPSTILFFFFPLPTPFRIFFLIFEENFPSFSTEKSSVSIYLLHFHVKFICILCIHCELINRIKFQGTLISPGKYLF